MLYLPYLKLMIHLLNFNTKYIYYFNSAELNTPLENIWGVKDVDKIVCLKH